VLSASFDGPQVKVEARAGKCLAGLKRRYVGREVGNQLLNPFRPALC